MRIRYPAQAQHQSYSGSASLLVRKWRSFVTGVNGIIPCNFTLTGSHRRCLLRLSIDREYKSPREYSKQLEFFGAWNSAFFSAFVTSSVTNNYQFIGMEGNISSSDYLGMSWRL